MSAEQVDENQLFSLDRVIVSLQVQQLRPGVRRGAGNHCGTMEVLSINSEISFLFFSGTSMGMCRFSQDVGNCLRTSYLYHFDLESCELDLGENPPWKPAPHRFTYLTVSELAR